MTQISLDNDIKVKVKTCVRVVDVEIVARLLVDRVTLGDPDVASVLPENSHSL